VGWPATDFGVLPAAGTAMPALADEAMRGRPAGIRYSSGAQLFVGITLDALLAHGHQLIGFRRGLAGARACGVSLG
jgi:hypothetical protein